MNFGLIADGNRRWAKKNNKSLTEGHTAGFLVIKEVILPTLRDYSDFDTITIYGFSTENWKRSPLEVKNLMQLFMKIFDLWGDDLTQDEIRLEAVGRKDRLPQTLVEKIEDLEEKTKKFRKFTIYLCLDYGSQDEITRGVKRIFENQKPEKFEAILGNLNEKKIAQNLEVPDLDLIYRPGGEFRISNFCLWQAAYAELFFEKKYLPDIGKKDILKIISDFKERNQRRGL